MRAITVRQPWAWAIIHGSKDVENRTRNIVGSYRGPVAIHAALAVSPAGYNDLNVLAAMVADVSGRTLTDGVRGVLGALIGVVDLTDAHANEIDPWAEPPIEPCSPWAMFGHHHLILENPRPLAVPIPYKGALGLWTLPDEVLAAVAA